MDPCGSEWKNIVCSWEVLDFVKEGSQNAMRF